MRKQRKPKNDICTAKIEECPSIRTVRAPEGQWIPMYGGGRSKVALTPKEA